MRRMRRLVATVAAAIVLAVGIACAQEPDGAAREQVEATLGAEPGRALADALERIAARTQAIDRIFKPLPLITPSEVAALRRYLNATHVERARSLGIPRSVDGQGLDALVREGRLVTLADSSEYWVVRESNDVDARVVPDTRALLVEIGRRFQQRLAELGAPPFRIEISSALRTAAGQAALRRSNANAAAGVSSHEFGTTVDIIYTAFAAPAAARAGRSSGEEDGESRAPAWLEPHLAHIAASGLERVAGRRSRELQAILADVLRELQSEGKVLVTLERQQPVFHITVAQRLDAAGR